MYEYATCYALLEAKNGNVIDIKVIDIVKDTPRYVVKNVELSMPSACKEPVSVKYAYTPKGDWIGDEKTAKFICDKKEIVPEKKTPSSTICTIGYSEKDKKWYGWSHRAIYGFKPGDVVKKGSSIDKYLPIGFKAKDEKDAKKMAVAFADSVS